MTRDQLAEAVRRAGGQRRLSMCSGVPQPTISRALVGKLNVSTEHAARILAALPEAESRHRLALRQFWQGEADTARKRLDEAMEALAALGRGELP